MLGRRSLIRILIGIELMLNSANINLIYFAQLHDQTDGHVAVLFILIIAICEAVIGLALFLRVKRFYHGANAGLLNEIHES